MSTRDKKEPIFGLDKIPDKVYIKALEQEVSDLKIEVGMLTSYVHELEDSNKELLERVTDLLDSRKFLNYKAAYKEMKILLKEEKDKNLLLRQKYNEKQKEYKKTLNELISLKLKQDGKKQ